MDSTDMNFQLTGDVSIKGTDSVNELAEGIEKSVNAFSKIDSKISTVESALRTLSSTGGVSFRSFSQALSVVEKELDSIAVKLDKMRGFTLVGNVKNLSPSNSELKNGYTTWSEQSARKIIEETVKSVDNRRLQAENRAAGMYKNVPAVYQNHGFTMVGNLRNNAPTNKELKDDFAISQSARRITDAILKEIDNRRLQASNRATGMYNNVPSVYQNHGFTMIGGLRNVSPSAQDLKNSFEMDKRVNSFIHEMREKYDRPETYRKSRFAEAYERQNTRQLSIGYNNPLLLGYDNSTSISRSLSANALVTMGQEKANYQKLFLEAYLKAEKEQEALNEKITAAKREEAEAAQRAASKARDTDRLTADQAERYRQQQLRTEAYNRRTDVYERDEARKEADSKSKRDLNELKAELLQATGQSRFTADMRGGAASILSGMAQRMRGQGGIVGAMTRFGDKLGANENGIMGKLFGKVLSEGTVSKLGVNAAGLALGGFTTAVIAAGKGIHEFRKATLDAFSSIEKLAVNMEVVYGSKTQSNQAFEKIQEYATKSPFGISQTTEMAVLLKQSGVYASELQHTLEMIGDVSAGNEDKMRRIANNYAQIQAIGKASMLDMRQFAYAGLPIYKEVAEYMQITQSELRSKISEGKVTAEIIENVFKRMTGEGGVFYKSVKKGSETRAAREVNLEDIKNLALSQWGDYFWNGKDHSEGASINKLWIKGWENFYKDFGDLGKSLKVEQDYKRNMGDKTFLDSLKNAYKQALADENPQLAELIGKQIKEYQTGFGNEDAVRSALTAKAKKEMGIDGKKIVSDKEFTDLREKLISIMMRYGTKWDSEQKKIVNPNRTWAEQAVDSGDYALLRGNMKKDRFGYRDKEARAYAKSIVDQYEETISESMRDAKLEALKNSKFKDAADAYIETLLIASEDQIAEGFQKAAGKESSLTSRMAKYTNEWKSSSAFGKLRAEQEKRNAFQEDMRNYDLYKSIYDSGAGRVNTGAEGLTKDVYSKFLESGFISAAERLKLEPENIYTDQFKTDIRDLISNIQDTKDKLTQLYGMGDKDEIVKALERLYNFAIKTDENLGQGKIDENDALSVESATFEVNKITKSLPEDLQKVIQQTFVRWTETAKRAKNPYLGNPLPDLQPLWKRTASKVTGWDIQNIGKDFAADYQRYAVQQIVSGGLQGLVKGGAKSGTIDSLMSYREGGNKVDWEQTAANLLQYADTWGTSLKESAGAIEEFNKSVNSQIDVYDNLLVKLNSTGEDWATINKWLKESADDIEGLDMESLFGNSFSELNKVSDNIKVVLDKERGLVVKVKAVNGEDEYDLGPLDKIKDGFKETDPYVKDVRAMLDNVDVLNSVKKSIENAKERLNALADVTSIQNELLKQANVFADQRNTVMGQAWGNTVGAGGMLAGAGFTGLVPEARSMLMEWLSKFSSTIAALDEKGYSRATIAPIFEKYGVATNVSARNIDEFIRAAETMNSYSATWTEKTDAMEKIFNMFGNSQEKIVKNFNDMAKGMEEKSYSNTSSELLQFIKDRGIEEQKLKEDNTVKQQKLLDDLGYGLMSFSRLSRGMTEQQLKNDDYDKIIEDYLKEGVQIIKEKYKEDPLTGRIKQTSYENAIWDRNFAGAEGALGKEEWKSMTEKVNYIHLLRLLEKKKGKELPEYIPLWKRIAADATGWDASQIKGSGSQFIKDYSHQASRNVVTGGVQGLISAGVMSEDILSRMRYTDAENKQKVKQIDWQKTESDMIKDALSMRDGVKKSAAALKGLSDSLVSQLSVYEKLSQDMIGVGEDWSTINTSLKDGFKNNPHLKPEDFLDNAFEAYGKKQGGYGLSYDNEMGLVIENAELGFKESVETLKEQLKKDPNSLKGDLKAVVESLKIDTLLKALDLLRKSTMALNDTTGIANSLANQANDWREQAAKTRGEAFGNSVGVMGALRDATLTSNGSKLREYIDKEISRNKTLSPVADLRIAKEIFSNPEYMKAKRDYGLILGASYGNSMAGITGRQYGLAGMNDGLKSWQEVFADWTETASFEEFEEALVEAGKDVKDFFHNVNKNIIVSSSIKKGVYSSPMDDISPEAESMLASFMSGFMGKMATTDFTTLTDKQREQIRKDFGGKGDIDTNKIAEAANKFQNAGDNYHAQVEAMMDMFSAFGITMTELIDSAKDAVKATEDKKYSDAAASVLRSNFYNPLGYVKDDVYLQKDNSILQQNLMNKLGYSNMSFSSLSEKMTEQALSNPTQYSGLINQYKARHGETKYNELVSEYNNESDAASKAETTAEAEEHLANMRDILHEIGDATNQASLGFADMTKQVIDLGHNLGKALESFASSAVSSTMSTWGKALAEGADSSEALMDNFRQLGAGLMQNMGTMITQAGLSMAIHASSKAEVLTGLAIAAAGAGASFLGGMLSASKDSDKEEDTYQKLLNLKQDLADLLKQAREDAIYYENTLRHKTAISANDALTMRKVNDAIITPSGNIISTHPDDYLIATKTPQTLGSGGAPTINFSVIDKSTGIVVTEQKSNYDKETNTMDLEVIIESKVQEIIASPKGDDAFAAREYRLNGRHVIA